MGGLWYPSEHSRMVQIFWESLSGEILGEFELLSSRWHIKQWKEGLLELILVF